jgi:rhodanese-related sulfurtransferase
MDRSASRSRSKRINLIVCCCWLVSGTCFRGTVCGDASAVTGDTAFVEVFDFGVASVNSEVWHKFTIVNKSASELRIKRASSSSNNLQIVSYPESLSANRKEAITVKLIPTEPGDSTQDISIEVEGAVATLLRYRMKGTVEGTALKNEQRNPLRGSIPSELISRKLRKRSAAVAISVDSVLRALKQHQDLVLIDVRKERDFERFRIPGSINIPLFAVKAKPFLKNRELVLIDVGHNHSSLEKECGHLNELGFFARLLDGGLRAWREGGGAIEGTGPAQRDLDEIAPQAFLDERHYENLVFINACESKKAEASYLIPDALPPVPPDNLNQLPAQIKEISNKHKGTLPLTFVVFDDGGEKYSEIRSLIKKAGIRNVLYLQGGLAAYERLLHYQAGLLHPSDDSRKVLRKCKSCP